MIVVGPLAWQPGDRPLLSARAAEWVLRELAGRVGAPSDYGAVAVVFRGLPRAEAEEWCAGPAVAVSLDLAAFRPSGAPPLELPPSLATVVPPAGSAPTPDGTAVAWPFDLPTAAFMLMSRWEEAQAGARDGRDRFQAADSLPVRGGYLDRPIIDEWCLVLRAWLAAAGVPLAPPRQFNVWLTHDVDAVRRFGSMRSVVRATALAARHAIGSLAHVLREAAVSRRDPARDPYVGGIRRLMDISERHGLRSSFFFKTSDAGPRDTGYQLAEPYLAGLLEEVRRRGHEIGFHPGYATLGNLALLRTELERLRVLTGEAPLGGRQHNLRFRVPDTWRHWDDVGLRYDSTLCYAERAGFRCGTCIPYRTFDLERDRPLTLIERPLIVMDTTLRRAYYEGLSAGAARRRILDLAARVRRVGGEFTLLWHNTSFDGIYAGWSDLYEPTIGDLARQGAA